MYSNSKNREIKPNSMKLKNSVHDFQKTCVLKT